MIHRTPIRISLSFLALVACAPAAPLPADSGSSEPEAQPADTNRIDIPIEVRRGLGITFAKVELRRVAQTMRVPGAFELEPLARREYHMALSGRVQLLVDQYDEVAEGQPLFRYQSPEWHELLHEILLGEQAMDSARAEIEVAHATLEEARQRLALLERRIAALAEAEFKQADLEFEAAELEASLPRLAAEIRLGETRFTNAGRTRRHALHRASSAAGIPEAELEARVMLDGQSLPTYLTIDWIEVRAQVSGVVESLAVTEGAFLQPPTNVLTTVDTAQVRFRALALQADLPRLAGASQARIVPPPSPGFPISGGIPASVSFGLEAHPEERTVPLIARSEQHADWIRPGVAAFLELVLDASEAASLAVPRSAIVRDGLHHILFRRDPKDPNRALRIEADMGVDDGQWVVLESGVRVGDEVVLAGAHELKLASQERGGAQAGGHVHADGSSHAAH